VLGLVGVTGSAGASGPAGIAGVTGAEGATGSVGIGGAVGCTGGTGARGAQGATGSAGEAGAAGLPGSTGTSGAAGLAGTTGVAGPEGQAGAAGMAGATGSAGETGVAGPVGTAGSAGPTGAEGECKALAYTEFYALMPPDNAATVGAGMPVQFPRSGPTTGVITRLGGASATEFVLPNIGTYQVTFSVSVGEPGQLALGLNSGSGMVELAYTAYGRATGTSLISGQTLVATTGANSVLELRNPAGNTPALTITPAAGGTHAAVASLVVQQLG
jgi:hypothetical protein